MKYSFGVNRKKYGEIIVENRRMSRYNEKEQRYNKGPARDHQAGNENR